MAAEMCGRYITIYYMLFPVSSGREGREEKSEKRYCLEIIANESNKTCEWTVFSLSVP